MNAVDWQDLSVLLNRFHRVYNQGICWKCLCGGLRVLADQEDCAIPVLWGTHAGYFVPDCPYECAGWLGLSF